jgi:5-oxoprolinase (ATP-hydrolysing) subunit C
MTLRVIDPGLCTLIVDHGRPRTRSLGVPVGGAADRTALALGNALVGNAPDAPALEFSLAGPTLETDTPLACVVFGPPFDVSRDGVPIRGGETFTLQPGQVLKIAGSPFGARGYLCVAGGLQSQRILESHSGLEPLRAGAEIACASATIHGRFVAPDIGLVQRFLTAPPAEGQTIRVVTGAQADWFHTADFYAQAFTVSPASNRMGLRLQGKPLALPDRELVSEPVCPGAVQVTRDGQCIVLGVDGQTIGGYPKIAQVTSADLDLVGQLRPGNRLRFAEVSIEGATRLYREQQAELGQWAARLRAALGGFPRPGPGHID